MESPWKLRYEQLEKAGKCSGVARHEQLRILDKTLTVVKRDIIFTLVLKFAASLVGMLMIGPANVTKVISDNQTTKTIQDTLQPSSKLDFLSVRRILSFVLMVYAAKSLWNGWCQLKLQKRFIEELERVKTAWFEDRLSIPVVFEHTLCLWIKI